MRRLALPFALTFAVALSVALLASCCTSRTPAARAAAGVSGTEFSFRGRLVMMGNVPHTFSGIRTEDDSKTYAFVTTASEEELLTLKGHLVEFVAILVSGAEAAKAGDASVYLKDGTVRLVSWKIVD